MKLSGLRARKLEAGVSRADISGYSFLAGAIRGILADECEDTKTMMICFLNAPVGRHPYFVTGLRAVIESLWQQFFLVPNQPENRSGVPGEVACHIRPVLVFGFGTALETALSCSQDDKWRMLFQWPGIAYLPYGFTKDQLIATARKVVEGANKPLPAGLLPTVSDALRLTAEVRHWLENRRRNTEGALINFESAKRGEKRLHDSHLEPVAAISEEHRAMLDRLWALEVPAERFARQIGGLAPLKAAIAGFETRWQALETARAALRASGAEEWPKRLADVVMELRQVLEALSAAIRATLDVDREMMGQEGN